MEKPWPIERLGAVLEKSLKRLDPSGRLVEYGVWPVWNEVVGDVIARNAQPEKIRHGTLFVKVSSPVWMQQLQYMKETITEKLNQAIGREVVRNVFFVVGNVQAAVAEKPASGPPPEAAEAPARLDDAMLGAIADPDVRRAFKRLFTAHARRKTRR